MSPKLSLDGTLPFPIELTPSPAAPSDTTSVFTSYWEAIEWPESRVTRWARPVASIAGGEWGTDTAAAAGAGGIAEVIGRRCGSCGGPLTLTSRSAFDQAQRGESVKCRGCTAHFEQRVARLGSAEAVAQRATRAAARLERDQEARQKTDTAAGRKAAVDAAYSTSRESYAPALHTATVSELVTLLTLSRFHMQEGITIALDDQEAPLLAPYSANEYFLSVLHRGLLRVHPSTPTNAFVWQAEHGAEAAVMSDRWYPGRLRLYRDTGSDPKAAAAEMREEVLGLLDLSLLTWAEQEDLVLLARDLLAEEGMAYLEHQLARYSLPAIAEQHRSRLTAVMQRAADHLSLGDIYRLAWSAASAATNLYQSTPASKANVSTFALNRFETRLAEVIEDSSLLLEPYSLTDQVQISTMARVVLMELLQRPVISATVSEVRDALPMAFDVQMRSVCLAALPAAVELETARSELSLLDAGTVASALAQLRDQRLPECATGCSHAQANYLVPQVQRDLQALSERIGESAAELAIVSLLGWSNWRDKENRSERPGDVLVLALRDEALGARGA